MNPDVLVQAKYAARSGAGFCKRNGLPSIADQGATVEMVDLITDVVNKGTDGRQARKDHLAKGRFQMRMLIQDLTWIALCVAGALGAGYAWADTMRRYVLRERIFILAVR